MSSDKVSLEPGYSKLPRSIAEGPLRIGNITVDCHILQDGSQVITQRSILKIMGRANPGGRPTKEIVALRATGVQIPVFLASNNLIPFIPNDLKSKGAPFIFVTGGGARAYGYKAEIIPDIIDTYLEARKIGGILTKDQIPIAATLEIVSRGLGRVGLSALINEACGFVNTEKEYLQKILNEYVNKLILPWANRFPSSFFNGYKKLYGIKTTQKIPMHVGHFINKYIYKELAPGVLEELRKLNPIEENGRRLHTHHQFLTPNKGVQALEKQVLQVNTILSMAKDRKEFDEIYIKVKEHCNEK